MPPEILTEKVSVNVNTSTLSVIDLLVDHGYYSNRSDFINQALRAALERQQTTIDHIVQQQTRRSGEGDEWFIGIFGLTRRDLEGMQARGETLRVRGYGLFVLDKDCPEELIYQVIESIDVRGKVRCAPGVKAHYGVK